MLLSVTTGFAKEEKNDCDLYIYYIESNCGIIYKFVYDHEISIGYYCYLQGYYDGLCDKNRMQII